MDATNKPVPFALCIRGQINVDEGGKLPGRFDSLGAVDSNLAKCSWAAL